MSRFIKVTQKAGGECWVDASRVSVVRETPKYGTSILDHNGMELAYEIEEKAAEVIEKVVAARQPAQDNC